MTEIEQLRAQLELALVKEQLTKTLNLLNLTADDPSNVGMATQICTEVGALTFYQPNPLAAGIDKVLVTLGYGSERIEQLTNINKLDDIYFQVDSLQRECIKVSNQHYRAVNRVRDLETLLKASYEVVAKLEVQLNV